MICCSLLTFTHRQKSLMIQQPSTRYPCNALTGTCCHHISCQHCQRSHSSLLLSSRVTSLLCLHLVLKPDFSPPRRLQHSKAPRTFLSCGRGQAPFIPPATAVSLLSFNSCCHGVAYNTCHCCLLHMRVWHWILVFECTCCFARLSRNSAHHMASAVLCLVHHDGCSVTVQFVRAVMCDLISALQAAVSVLQRCGY